MKISHIKQVTLDRYKEKDQYEVFLNSPDWTFVFTGNTPANIVTFEKICKVTDYGEVRGIIKNAK